MSLIEHPLTEKQIEHLNVEVGEIKKLTLALNSLKEADLENYYESLISPSVRDFLENKGWTLEDIKAASEKSQEMNNRGFCFCDGFYLWSQTKIWCWDKYLDDPFVGRLIWWFYGDWID